MSHLRRHIRRRVQVAIALVLSTVLFTGCPMQYSGKAKSTTGEKKSSTRKQSKAAPPVVLNDTYVKMAGDFIAWRRRTTAIMEGVTDERTAAAAAPELQRLCDELVQLNARSRTFSSPTPQADLDAMKAKYGRQVEESQLAYIAAASKFDRQTQKAQLVPVFKKHGIDILRMRRIKD